MRDSLDIPASEVLLQQPPFRFVDSLVHYDETTTRVTYRVPGEGLFMEGGRFAASGVMEHMAQSAGARVGYVSKYILHIPVQVGFIGQIKNFRLRRSPLSGELLQTDVTVVHEMAGITLSDITVRCGGEVVAQAQFKTALKNDE